MKRKDLTIRQRKFIDNLFKGMSQKRAYIEAGYAEKSAEVCASQLLRNPKIQEEIERRLREINRANKVRLARISEAALAKLLSIINEAEEDKVRLEAIKDALDRAGLKPEEKVNIGGGIKVEFEIVDNESKT